MYDFVVYGATGYTGKKVAARLKERFGSGGYTYAIAGRNAEKLEKVKADCGDETMGVIIANSADVESIKAMCKQAKVLLNCVGPYRYTGEDVVLSCIEAGTHYVDVTGEPEFMEKMQYVHSEAAEAAGCVIVPGCGFDSVPADVGTYFAQSKFKDGEVCTVIESYLTVLGPASAAYATYESAVMGISKAHELRALRKEHKRPKAVIPGPKPGKPARRYDNRQKKYLLPFMGADPSVVKRSQNVLYQLGHPASHYLSYTTIAKSSNYYKSLIGGGIGLTMAQSATGRKLLLKYPETFTRGLVTKAGPSAEDLAKCSFEMLFLAKGYSSKEKADDPAEKPDIEHVTTVTGPEPGYVATPIILLECAITVLEDADRIKAFAKSGGGVYTPGVAFADTDLIERLKKGGVEFNEVE